MHLGVEWVEHEDFVLVFGDGKQTWEKWSN